MSSALSHQELNVFPPTKRARVGTDPNSDAAFEQESVELRETCAAMSMSSQTHILELPTEILDHIFRLCARISGTVPLPLRKRHIPIQIVISHVCSKWRQIALDSPELWADVSIEDKDLFKDDHVCQAWLSRARLRPLDFRSSIKYLNLKLPIPFEKLSRMSMSST